MQDLANQLNRTPLPPLHEYYGIRLPPPAERLTQLNYDLKNKGRPMPAPAIPDASNFDFSMDTSGFVPDAAVGGPSTAGMDLDTATFGADLFGDFDVSAFGGAGEGADQSVGLPLSGDGSMFMQQQQPPLPQQGQEHQNQAQSQPDQSMDQDAPGEDEEEDAMGEADDDGEQQTQ